MSSRDQILSDIRKLNLPAAPLPAVPDFAFDTNMVANYLRAAEANHVTVLHQPEDVKAALQKVTEGYSTIYDCTQTISSTVDDAWLANRELLRTLDVVIVQGNMGVAENAAIWIPESNVAQRILSFVTLHYIVILKTADLVANMHQAYAKIDQIPGFGVFVAGPSKTADIEQSLVIGAHGPKKMTVLLV